MTTITLPQLRDALRRLEANVSAEELWCALHQQVLDIPAAPQAPRDPLSHYTAMAAEAVAQARRA